MSKTNPELVVAVITYRRPELVARMVPLVLAQAEALRPRRARMVVVDNDAQASAREALAPFADRLSYVVEPEPGIAAARNRALTEAGEADLVAFIDDDEQPTDGWLQALYDAWAAFGSAVVTGPVEYRHEVPVDPWIEAAGLFTRIERPHGAVCKGADSANILLDLNQLRPHGIRFDAAFGLSGGSDTMLAHTARSKGLSIRWAANAVTSELVPASRATREWAFKRTMRTSNTWSRVKLGLADSPAQRARWRAELTARGGVRMARGGVNRLLARGTHDPARDARGAVDVASGLGLLMGAYGRVRTEYARPAA